MKERTDETIRDVTIVYTDDLSEWFEAIRLTKNGVVIVRILNETMITCGFIPKENIKEIKNGNRRV